MSLIQSKTPAYAEQLRLFTRFFDELAGIPLSGEESLEPCWVNPWLIGLDTVSLYAYTRLRRPAHYVEIGSGQSTKVVARARRDGGSPTVITSIDPHPRSEIDRLCDDVVRSPLEQADLERCFGALGPGDIVFFDGSHRVLPNSDCVAFFLDVLPALPDGVLVGIHDVYLPEDYPQGFLEMWWSEQYVLGALLLADAPRLEVVLPTYYVTGVPEVAQLLEPLFGRSNLKEVNPRGSLFWIETTSNTAR
ncbi:MAG TPA: class I SAM-dependent methyltransferase [Acidimicrobiales bacterium]|nr:class I SAM-dependent methyltransferase [Acidimicrobiales bacterium]